MYTGKCSKVRIKLKNNAQRWHDPVSIKAHEICFQAFSLCEFNYIVWLQHATSLQKFQTFRLKIFFHKHSTSTRSSGLVRAWRDWRGGRTFGCRIGSAISALGAVAASGHTAGCRWERIRSKPDSISAPNDCECARDDANSMTAWKSSYTLYIRRDAGQCGWIRGSSSSRIGWRTCRRNGTRGSARCDGCVRGFSSSARCGSLCCRPGRRASAGGWPGSRAFEEWMGRGSFCGRGDKHAEGRLGRREGTQRRMTRLAAQPPPQGWVPRRKDDHWRQPHRRGRSLALDARLVGMSWSMNSERAKWHCFSRTKRRNAIWPNA